MDNQNKRCEFIFELNCKDALAFLWALYLKKEIPTIIPWSVTPLVRCKDCKHYGMLATKEERETSVDLVCDYWDSDGLAWYDFCSYGEKKEEKE